MKSKRCSSYCVTTKCGDIAKTLMSSAITSINRAIRQLSGRNEELRDLQSNAPWEVSSIRWVFERNKVRDERLLIGLTTKMLNDNKERLRNVLDRCGTSVIISNRR